MNTIVVNAFSINKLKSEQYAALTTFFLHNKNSLYSQNTEYQHNYKNRSYQFIFEKSWLKRKSASKKTEIRYEVFNPAGSVLGEGGFGAVYPTIATIKFNGHKPIVKSHKRRVVKVSECKSGDEKTKDRIENEYKALNDAHHLGVKEPVYTSTQCFMIMRKAPGVTLEALLAGNRLTTLQRKELTLALFDALNEQILLKQLIHRDVKPENILVDLKQKPPKVTFVDYGFALRKNGQDNKSPGTMAYCSPETLTTRIYTSKSDCYSLGRVLAYLWGDKPSNYKVSLSSELASKSTNKEVFSNSKVILFKIDQDIILGCINGLMQRDPGARMSVEDAKKRFNQVDWKKYSLASIQKNTKDELLDYEKKLTENRFKKIDGLLVALRNKVSDLQRRGFNDEANLVSDLHTQLAAHTQQYRNEPSYDNLVNYRTKCKSEFEKHENVLNQHRDLNWIFAEIMAAISLLVVGYTAAVAIQYSQTGRLGLFSQTQSAKIAEELCDTIGVKRTSVTKKF